MFKGCRDIAHLFKGIWDTFGKNEWNFRDIYRDTKIFLCSTTSFWFVNIVWKMWKKSLRSWGWGF